MAVKGLHHIIYNNGTIEIIISGSVRGSFSQGLMILIKWPFFEHKYWQCSQEYSQCSPKYSQCSQEYRRSPVWGRVWRVKIVFWENCLLHCVRVVTTILYFIRSLSLQVKILSVDANWRRISLKPCAGLLSVHAWHLEVYTGPNNTEDISQALEVWSHRILDVELVNLCC